MVDERAVRDAHVRLVNLDRIERAIGTFNRNTAAAKRDQRLVNASAGVVVEYQTTPLAGDRVVNTIFVRIKRAASAETVVGDRSEYHFALIVSFGDQIRSSALQLDARVT